MPAMPTKLDDANRERRSYFVVSAFVLVTATAAAHLYGLLTVSLGCAVNERRTEEFVAYCDTKAGFSVDQGVYFFGWDRRVVQSIKEADVLLLGNSRLQLGLDPELVGRALGARNLKYHYLGFGGEQYRFARALIEKHRLRPKLLVINVDPFFEGHLHWAGEILLTRHWINGFAIFRYRKTSQDLRQSICHRLRTHHPYCRSAVGTLFRERTSGAWRFAYWEETGTQLNPVARSIDERKIEILVRNAKQFLADMALPKECVLMLQVPGRETFAELPHTIASAVSAVSIRPVNVALETFDGDHLARGSVRIWTAAVLPKLENAVDACLGALANKDSGKLTRPTR